MFSLIPEEDWSWLRDVYNVDTSEAAVVILYGHESSPDKIEVYAHNHFEAEPMRIYKPAYYPTYYVVVGNIGETHRGPRLVDAEHVFNVYAGQSAGGYGRVGGEPVTLFKDDEIIREYSRADT